MSLELRGPALLFCPGDRPDRFDKALRAADLVLLDLEDGVGAGAKAIARDAVEHALPRLGSRAVVRVNARGTAEHEADVAMLRRAGATTLMLPKTASAADLDDLDGFEVIALCETAAGITNATEIARHPRCAALFWGGEDLIADLGGRSSRGRDGRFLPVVQHARSAVLLAGGVGGVPVIDSVYIDIDDVDGLRRESEEAAASGFAAKAVIHPSHAEVVRRAFAPDEQAIAQARAVLEAVERGSGAIQVGGRMIDEPLVRQARRTLAAARAAGLAEEE